MERSRPIDTTEMAGGVDGAVAAGVLAAVNAVEDAVDTELQRLENLDEDGLGNLREQRLQQMKRDAKQVFIVYKAMILL